MTVASRIKASALRRGIPVKVRVAAAGKITITGKVGKRVVARGSAQAKRAGTVTVRVRAIRKQLRRLRGKTLVLRVTAGGKSTTLRRKLR